MSFTAGLQFLQLMEVEDWRSIQSSGMVLLAFTVGAQVQRECFRRFQPFQFFPESGL
jgi:hypothetical protein